MNELILKIEDILKRVYKDEYQDSYLDSMKDLIQKYENEKFGTTKELTHENVYLITYGDSIYEEGKPTLSTLNKFLNNHWKDYLTDVHILPMFPYTSDDGFSVVDYLKIDEKLGSWDDLERLGKDYRLMYDFVVNHISKSSKWYQDFAKGIGYENYFVEYDENFDSSNVTRPRALPLFHEVDGKKVWTTFSEDQIDINVRNFPTLVEVTDIFLTYLLKDATSIRLDAIGFMWKESGTTCIHLEETHLIIKMWRLLNDYFKPNALIITETNVPHQENVSYFGNGHDEAALVYNFTLPPLTLFSLINEDASKLTKWAADLELPSDEVTFFNFLASHDGIGMRPVENILTSEEIDAMIENTKKQGGFISYKNNPDGSQSVYEMNINYKEACGSVEKFLLAHAIQSSFVGVPAVYYHSLLGSGNHVEGVHESGINRRINRKKLSFDEANHLMVENEDVINKLREILDFRKSNPVFSPKSKQEIIDLGKELFVLRRYNDTDSVTLICNVTGQAVTTNLNGEEITLNPYEFRWMS